MAVSVLTQTGTERLLLKQTEKVQNFLGAGDFEK